MTKFFFFVFFLPFVWVSCTDDNMVFNIGNDEVDVKTRMGIIDTLTVKSYTVILDSVPTSGLISPAAVIGRYEDVAFGTVTASSFFRVVPPVNTPNKYPIPKNSVFDSVSLFLVYNGGYYSGDTLLPFTINVHRLTEKLRPHDDGFFYNHDSIGADPEIFGRATFKPRPNSKDTVWIKLDQAFGTELFDLMDEDELVVTDVQYFLEYFKGFMLRYDDMDRTLLSFALPASGSGNIAPAMRVHFHYIDGATKKSHFDFRVQSRDLTTQDQLLFNRFILKDPLIELPASQQEKLPVSLTGNRSFVQAGVGIVTRFEIPYLKNLYYIDNDIRILDAKLIIEPARKTYNETSLPKKISLYTTDDRNRWGSILLNKLGNPSEANLVVDLLYEEETKYTFDITNFLSSKLVQETDVIPAMLLTISPDDLYTTNRRLVLGSQLNRDNKVTLQVRYMNIE